jgi:hypothetical protein
LIVWAILLAVLLTTVTLASTLENANYLAGLINAPVAVIALLALYQRQQHPNPQPPTPGVTRPWRFRNLFTGWQWGTIAGGVILCGVLGTTLAIAAPDRGGNTDRASASGLTSPTVVPPTTPGPTETSTVEPTTSADATPSGTPTDSPSPAPTSDADGSQPLAPLVYFDALDPAQGSRRTGPVVLAAKQFPRSIENFCYRANSDNVEWNVAGYQKFTATLGVDDNAEGASGRTAEFIFYNQDNRKMTEPIDVALGRSKQVSINLNGAIRLRVSCAGRDTKTNEVEGFYAALGDALISK